MKNSVARLMFVLVLAVLPLIVSVVPSHALPSFGSQVDTACQAFNGTTPFATQSCALCHSSGSPSTSDLNANAQKFLNGTITAICPAAPVANAGPAQTVQVGATVTLDGSGSTDPNGHPLTYQWKFVSVPTGSGATLVSPTGVKPTFVADLAGSYVVQVIVTDNTAKLTSTPATVTITTVPGNTPPVASLTVPLSVASCANPSVGNTRIAPITTNHLIAIGFIERTSCLQNR